MSGETARPAPAWFVQLFAHRRWIRRTEPFPHIYARDVFTAGFYERLLAETARVRASGTDNVSLWELRDGPLAVFTSREWHDLIAGLTDLPLTGDVTGELRHHPAGAPAQESRNGLRHTVFPWHGESGGADTDGAGAAGTDRAGAAGGRAAATALALLFHLGPGEWRAEDGGETALYPVTATGAPARVPPLGNSMVLFECAPHTWHGHLGGNRLAGDSVLMWLHRPLDAEPGTATRPGTVAGRDIAHRTEGEEYGRR